ncbi:MAG TPA: RNA-binding protein [Gammaproteobacteria bacterium]
MKLLVRNLARTTTENELRSLFEQYGQVQSCNLVMDPVSGKSKGFGFIEIPKPAEARTAMRELNQTSLDGNSIRVKAAD